MPNKQKETDFYDNFDAPLEEAAQAIVVAQKMEPRLSDGGFNDRPADKLRPKEMATTIAFLRHCRPTKTTGIGSYGLKHAAERWGRANKGVPYVSNGALIAAALYLGLRVKPYSINAEIGVNRNDVQELDPDCIWSAGYRRKVENNCDDLKSIVAKEGLISNPALRRLIRGAERGHFSKEEVFKMIRLVSERRAAAP
jgi:hypothetical protein